MSAQHIAYLGSIAEPRCIGKLSLQQSLIYYLVTPLTHISSLWIFKVCAGFIITDCVNAIDGSSTLNCQNHRSDQLDRQKTYLTMVVDVGGGPTARASAKH